ncbi:3'-5' exoribonuclease 1 [Cryptotermes secundus]|uniref:3'-5' exoribonuclease 1 n=2 Tax=Cryptotermes secundus TaxID=105785 RepID=A0A2J7RMH2_9NEOP|nr:3'-5' exoribonuclease 1 isoform X2 [Cryptotermes secundus]PNF42020.1 3'-5' exoribonuclease 1 [Cryptotermes secundus]PNF42021.1 3'-5' exoribonuclease 1 [Cryptotermes secundus]PNF42022.1 3'-5' exoribonuclease 1 [Cryptotermes secundus]
MSKAAVVSKLKELKLSTEGNCDVLKKRLKNYYKKKKLTSANLFTASKLSPYYVIVDFEATCQETNVPDYQHEIIEFPAVLVSTELQQVIDHFQAYCRPVLNSTLSGFCKELTGITQEDVDTADTFPQVVKDFEAWLTKHKLGSKHKFTVVTDGPWDMGRFLYGQCKISGLPYPKFAKKWINIRKAFSNFYKCRRFSLKMMLEHLELDFEGRPHCGLDDARNIARVLLRMISDGASIQVNERIHLLALEAKSKVGKPECVVVPVTASNPYNTANKMQQKRRQRDHQTTVFSDSDEDST